MKFCSRIFSVLFDYFFSLSIYFSYSFVLNSYFLLNLTIYCFVLLRCFYMQFSSRVTFSVIVDWIFFRLRLIAPVGFRFTFGGRFVSRRCYI